MYSYTAPLRDMQSVIEEVLAAPAAWREMQAFADLDADTARQILEEAGKFASGALAPINSTADLEGCTWRDGVVTTPSGYRDAYAAYVAGGWPALTCDPHDGGQGLPVLLNAAVNEMTAAANHAWTMYPDLLHGAYECLRAHGSPELKQRYLAKIASGEWLATNAKTCANSCVGRGRSARMRRSSHVGKGACKALSRKAKPCSPSDLRRCSPSRGRPWAKKVRRSSRR